jgi:hypothetical protein
MKARKEHHVPLSRQALAIIATARAMASILLNESGKWGADAIERALAHGDTDRIRGTYSRGRHW